MLKPFLCEQTNLRDSNERRCALCFFFFPVPWRHGIVKVAGLRCMLVRAHCVSELARPRRGVLHSNAGHVFEPLFFSGRHCAVARGQHDHPIVLASKYEVQDNTLATAPLRAIGELTEDEHNTLVVEIRVQASPAAECDHAR